MNAIRYLFGGHHTLCDMHHRPQIRRHRVSGLTLSGNVVGLNMAKEYADGSRIAYAYTDNGHRTRTTWARARGRRTPTMSTILSAERPTPGTYVLPNGGIFSARLTRKAGRKELVTRRDYDFGGQSAY